MAKIRKEIFSFRNKGAQKVIQLTIEYKNVFYVILPEELELKAKKIQWTEKADELKLEWLYDRSKKLKGIAITGKTEQELLDTVPATLQALYEMGETVRDVIIVFFEKFGDMYRLSDIPRTEKGFQMVLYSYKYAKEAEDSLSGAKHYYEERTVGGRAIQHKLHNLQYVKHVVIPDTPANRANVEYLYSAMEKISGRLAEICKDGDKIQMLDVTKLLN